MANNAAKQRREPRVLVAFIFRILQIFFCVVCLGAAAHWAHVWMPFRLGTFQVYLMLQSVNLAIFASGTGILLSAFMLFAPRIAPAVADDLPGLIDLVLSTIWAVFFLSAGASLLSWGACKSNSLCMAWNATIGLCFFLWILYGVTAVTSALDLRAQIQALRGPAPQATGSPKAAGNISRPGTPPAPALTKSASKTDVKATVVEGQEAV